MKDILNGVAPAQVPEHVIASRLGPEMDFRIGTIAVHEREPFITDEFRPHFTGKCPKKDLAAALFQETLNLLPAGIHPIRPVSERIGRDKTKLLMPLAVPGDLIDRPVPHAVAEDLRCLAVPAGERTSPGDLYVSFHF